MRVSRKDFAGSRDQFRADAEKMVRGFIGKTESNADTNAKIHITGNGIRHTLSGAQKGLLMAATKLPELLRKAKRVKTEPDKHGRPNVRAVHAYQSDIDIDHESHTAHLIVVEDNNGNQFYDLALMRKKGRGIRVKGDSPDQHQNPIPGPFDEKIDVNPEKSKSDRAGREKGRDGRGKEDNPNHHRHSDTRPFDGKVDQNAGKKQFRSCREREEPG